MIFKSEGVAETSVHYFIPQPTTAQSYLYSLLSVGRFDCDPTYHVERHNFNSFLMIVMLSGSLSYTQLSKSGTVQAGQVLLLDCCQPHSYQANTCCSFLFLHFGDAQSREIYTALHTKMGNVFEPANMVALCHIIDEILNCMRLANHIDRTHASQLVYAALMQLLAASPVVNEGLTGNLMVDAALEYIHQHLAEKITVHDIAESIGYTENYFSQKFSQATGITPYQFLLHSRIERAQLLLQTTSLSIREIAEQTGFNSVANFSYAFRKEVQCTPHAFRGQPV